MPGGGERPWHEIRPMATRVKPGPPSSARPTGTVTFLFSDIEGSTERWENDREAMEPALALHDALMRATLETRRAYIFKTIGDAFCAAFASAADAVAAALDAQRALAAADFSEVGGIYARMALHTGESAERDGDYFGPAVNRVARLLAIAHGGQVVLSRVVADESSDALPAGVTFCDLGEHQLKDLAQPERVYQLCGPGLRADFPPLRSLSALSSFILDPEAIRETPSFTGRDAELESIAALLGSGAKTVVYGLGGTGKSAVAREFAWRNREQYAIIAWLDAETESGIIDGFIKIGSLFVSGLDQLTDRRRAAQQAKATMLGSIAGLTNPILLIFDNLASRQLLREWAPREGVQTLATSRNADWGGKAKTVLLSPWPLDDATRYLNSESARTDLTDIDARAIAEALGGLPLAVAHAAAYLGSLHTVTARSYLAQIERHMAQAPDGAEYSHAVFATFQEALAKAEHTQPGAAAVLCLAAFFAPDAIPETLFQSSTDPAALRPPLLDGASAADLGWTLADAARRDEALGALDRLSLVRFAADTRTFSVHRLVQSAARDLVGSAASVWIERAVASVNAAFPEPKEATTWPQCEPLVSHAQAALAALPSDCAPSAPAAELANRCGLYLYLRGAFAQAEPLLRRAVAIAEPTYGSNHSFFATTLNELVILFYDTNRFTEAESLLRRAVAIFEANYGPDHLSLAAPLHNLAILPRYTNRPAEAEPLMRRAVEIWEASYGANHVQVAFGLNNLATLLTETNRYAAAEPLYRRGLAIYEGTYGTHHPHVAMNLNNLANLLRDTKRFAEAEPLYRRSLAIRESSYGPDHPYFATTLNDLAQLLRDTERSADAEPLFRRALVIQEASHGAEHPVVAETLNNLALLLLRTSRSAEAEALYRRALAINEASFGADHPEVARTLNNLAELLRETKRSAAAEALVCRALAIKERIADPLSQLSGPIDVDKAGR